jgi:DNA-binding winged helix-turn-helix (wHTH) protein
LKKVRKFLENHKAEMIEQSARYQFGPYILDASDRTLRVSDKTIPLIPKAFDVLLILVQRSGQIVEKSYFLNTVWANTFVEESNLTFVISVLRKALGEKPNQPHYIETVPKHGYKFIAQVNLPISGPSRKRSLAVFPFKLISAERGDEYLGFGIADALITNLSNIQQIAVRPTTSILKYKDPSNDIQSIGEQLQVDSIVDGTIQQSGTRIRVSVQLINPSC